MEIVELTSIISDVKNSLDDLDSRFDTAEEKISDFEAMTIELTQIEAQRENKVKIMKKASVTCGTTTVTCGTTLNCLIYVYLEAQKERDWGRKYISRNNGQKFSKIDENIKHLDPRILMNPKKKKT